MQRNKESKDEDNDYLGVILDRLINLAEGSIYNGCHSRDEDLQTLHVEDHSLLSKQFGWC